MRSCARQLRGCARHRALLNTIPREVVAVRQFSSSSVRNSATVADTTTPATERREFKAETKQLLDIVAKSLYSEREVFLRELLSNAADALEKVRYTQLKGDEIIEDTLSKLSIDVSINSALNTLTIEDNGIGMNKEELIANLGTIARSGSKEFMRTVSEAGEDSSSIIGQFGVGFYSAFMVGDKVTVMTRSAKPDSIGYVWSSDGSNSYELNEAAGLARGTRIVIQLKEDAEEFCTKDKVTAVIKKHSNFVGYPIFLDGAQINTVDPVWTRKSSEVTVEEHKEFYQSISGSQGTPMYTMMFSTENPVSIKCVLYVPQFMPKMDLTNMGNFGISLYSRKVMVQASSNKLLPDWLMFLQGVVDCEDIPLNLSREMLQDSVIISKIKSVITAKMISYLNRMAKRDPAKFEEFHKEFGKALRVGLLTCESLSDKQDIAKLLRFESSAQESGVLIGLEDYVSRMPDSQKHIYYLSAPSREAALSSPYYETLAQNELEVLLSYNKDDDIVLFGLENFKEKRLSSAENANVKPVKKEGEPEVEKLQKSEGKKLSSWMRDILGRETVKEVKMSDKQHSHPAIVTVDNLTQLRRYMDMIPPEERESSQKYLLHNNVVLELNPSHPIIKQLSVAQNSNPDLAELVAQQLFDNALMNADLVQNPRSMVSRLNKLLELTLENDSKTSESE